MPTNKIIRNEMVTSIDTGRTYWVNDLGLAEFISDHDSDEYFNESDQRLANELDRWERGGRDAYAAWDRGY